MFCEASRHAFSIFLIDCHLLANIAAQVDGGGEEEKMS